MAALKESEEIDSADGTASLCSTQVLSYRGGTSSEDTSLCGI